MDSTCDLIIDYLKKEPIGETDSFIWFITDIGIVALFKGEILFKNLSKDEFEFVWGKLYTSYINALNKELTYELISDNNIMEPAFNLEPSY